MFIDYVSLMLVNMTAGFFLLAYFLYKDIDSANRKRWSPAFAVIGFIALATGLHMSFTWPLPGSYNEAYGSTSVLYGGLFLGAAWAIAKDWDLFAIGLYAFFSSIVPLIIGPRIIILGMTTEPIPAGTGFILSGIGGILVATNLCWRTNKVLRLTTIIVLLIVGIIWAFTGYAAFWEHLATNAKWIPSTMSK